MENFTIRISSELLNNIRDIAKEEDRSVNHIINALVKKGLEYGESEI